MPYATRTIVTPYADIRLTETDGTGLPLLLLHGSGASRRVFDLQLESGLAERHRVLAMDLPGHGESSDARDPSRDYTITGLADCVASVLEQLGIGRVAVFGWSLGGHIAIELMHRHPTIAGLILTGTPPVSHGPIGMLRGFHANWDMFLASKERYTPRDVERYAQLCYGNAVEGWMLDDVRRTDGRIRPTFSRSMMRGDGVDQRRTIEESLVPIALVNGEHDPIIKLSYVSSLTIPTLWDGHALVLSDAGHAAFRDVPNRFNALLMRFASDAESWHVAPSRMARSVA